MVGAGPEVLTGVRDAVRGGRWAAVVDPRWPTALVDAVRAQLSGAAAAGRLRAGDLVLCTSGSTGSPRAVLRTAASWDASVAPLTALTGIGGSDAVWLPGPLCSSLFLYGAWHADAVGAAVLVQGDPPARATALHAVPALLARAVEAGEAGALPLVRTAVAAGDAVPAPLRRRAAALGWRVVEYYGAAELSFVAWRAGDDAMRAFPGVEVADRDGRLWARSPYLARGYLDGGDGGPLRRDGAWATVGDLGSVAADGAVVVRGRGGTVVTTGGHTVVVEEVERALAGVEGVGDLAVVGVPHPTLGEVLAAVVVPAPRGPEDGAGLAARLAAATRALPRPARPPRWHTAAALPRTASGKVDRQRLADAVTAGALTRLERG